MNAQSPCPANSALMQAWKACQDTEEYKNSHSWAIRFIPDDDLEYIERVRASGANAFTKEMKIKAVEGSLWAAFARGWAAAGGKNPFEES